MTGEIQTVRRLSIRDIAVATEVLAQAFHDDPLWIYLEPNSKKRKKIIPTFFKLFVNLQLSSDHLFGIGNPIEGVASWSPPSPRRISAWEILKAAWRIINSGIFDLIFSPILSKFMKSWRIFTRIEKMHKKYAPQPHYYLEMIGVLPFSHGNGLASKLINYILEQADAKSISAYLETMNPKNVGLYEHFGFECREHWNVPGTKLSVWALYRPAK